MCRGWKNVRETDDCKLRRLELHNGAYQQIPNVFCEVKSAYKNGYEAPAESVLGHHGSWSELQELMIAATYDTVPAGIMVFIHRLGNLRKLELFSEEGYGLVDWEQLCRSMPLTLTSLRIDVSVDQPQSDIVLDPNGYDSLIGFNRLHRLESLCVGCDWLNDEESDACQLHGDLWLPCLKKLELTLKADRIIACDLSFTGIPDSCSVVCELEVETESAKHRLQG